jgi:hypothetical protein
MTQVNESVESTVEPSEIDMNADVYFPSQLNWSAQELAEAVPLRLHELFAFDAGRDGQACNAAHEPQRLPQREGYVPVPPASPLFRIR